MVKILVKKLLENIDLPKYKTEGSSGMDIVANIKNDLIINSGEKEIIPYWNCSCNTKWL